MSALLYIKFISTKRQQNIWSWPFFLRALQPIKRVTIMALGVACMYVHSLSTFSLPKKKKKERTPDRPSTLMSLHAWYPRALRGKGRRERWERFERNQRHIQDGRWSVQDKPCRAKILQKWLFCQKERVCSARKGKTKGIQRFFCGGIWRYSVPSGSVDLSVVLLLDSLRLPAWLSAEIRAWEIKSAQRTRT